MKKIALLLGLSGLLLSLQTACKSSTNALKSATAPAQQTASALSLPPSQNPAEDVRNAFQKLETASTYRLEILYPDSPAKSVMEYVAPNRRHNSLRGQMEYITIGDDVYRKEKGEPWVKDEGVEKAISGMVGSDMALGFIKPSAGQAVKYIEAQMKDGLATRVYTYEDKISFQLMKRTMWIRASDGLPHHLEAENKIEGKNKGEESIIKYTVRFTYDPNLKIEPPL